MLVPLIRTRDPDIEYFRTISLSEVNAGLLGTTPAASRRSTAADTIAPLV
jgi:hypothetical protein